MNASKLNADPKLQSRRDVPDAEGGLFSQAFFMALDVTLVPVFLLDQTLTN